METIDWNAKIKEALERTDIMALSTIGEDGPWTSPVQYSWKPTLELSFVSMMNTKHVENILKDSRVSVAIYMPKQLTEGGNLGLQITGNAQLVSDGNEGWNTFKITPQEVWCFDTRVSRQRERVYLANLKL